MSDNPDTEQDPDECPRCHSTMFLRDGCEHRDGDVCDECAPEVIDELAAERDTLKELLKEAVTILCNCESKDHPTYDLKMDFLARVKGSTSKEGV